MVKAPVTVNAWNTIKGYTRRALGFEPLPLLLLTNNREWRRLFDKEYSLL
jgi:hypothetical protein